MAKKKKKKKKKNSFSTLFGTNELRRVEKFLKKDVRREGFFFPYINLTILNFLGFCPKFLPWKMILSRNSNPCINIFFFDFAEVLVWASLSIKSQADR